MKDNLIRINEYEYVTTVDHGNVTIKYLTRDHKRPQSIYDQYVEIYSKVTKKTLTMPLKELQEGLKSEDWSQKLADTLLKSTFGQSNELKRALN
jgi:hypothetical protein